MISRKYIVGPVVAALIAASLVVGVGLAVGRSGGPDPSPIHVDRQVANQAAHPASAVVVSAFSTFASSSGAATTAEQATLRNALGAEPGADYGAIGNADFSMAKAAPISGSSQRAWLVPSGDAVCVVLPDPGDGFASSCQTVSDIKAGKGVLTLTPQPGSADTTAYVAVIVPDGASAPSLDSPQQASKRLSVSGNVAASVASTSDKITTSAGSLPLTAG